jgi:rRNA-processing protein FCF1
MTRVLCDTDFLLKITTEPLPEFSRFLAEFRLELATLPRIEAEIRGLSRSQNQRTARKARTALLAISQYPVKILRDRVEAPKKTDADVLLIDCAEKSRPTIIVATLDHSILSVLQRKRLPYLTLRKDRPFFQAFESATYLLDKDP